MNGTLLSNTIALLTLALMLASEARQAQGRWRAGLFGFATVVALLAVALGPITKLLPAVGTFFDAIFGSPLAWFVLLMGAFFVFRPFWSGIRPTRDGAALNAAILSVAENHRNAIDEIRREFAEHKAHMELCYSAHDQARLSLASEIAELRRGGAALEETIKRNDEHIRQSLYAILARERLNEMGARIEELANELCRRLTEGERYTSKDWDEWVNAHHNWERTLGTWIDLARWYAKDVQSRVLTIDDREYDETWNVVDEQFPNADAVRRFKRHRIIQSHWELVRDQVSQGVERVAFSGMTEKDQHGGQFHQ